MTTFEPGGGLVYGHFWGSDWLMTSPRGQQRRGHCWVARPPGNERGGMGTAPGHEAVAPKGSHVAEAEQAVEGELAPQIQRRRTPGGGPLGAAFTHQNGGRWGEGRKT